MKIRTVLIALVIAALLFPNYAQAQPSSDRVSTWPTAEQVVALTFDAGSDRGISEEILNILEERDVLATFFLTGHWIENYPDDALRITRANHTLGNHSYSHPDMTTISSERIREEITRTENLARDVLGSGLRPYFRPPHGAYNDEVLRVIAEEGYEYTVMWTVDTLDWDGATADQIVRRVEDALRPGAIILMHVGSGTETADALPRILDLLEEREYRPVTLHEMSQREPEKQAYQVQPGDTLYGIAEATGVDAQEIARANQLTDPYIIRVGDILIIPGAEPEEVPEDDPEEAEPEETEPAEPESTEPETEEPTEPEEEEDPPQDSEDPAPWWAFPGRIFRLLLQGFWDLASEGVRFLIDVIRR